MIEQKSCEQCGSAFTKPYSEGRPAWSRRRFCSLACKSASQRGQPSARKGRTFPSNAPRIPCRVCGGPTSVTAKGNERLIGLLPCADAACRAASRATKNARIAARASADYASGRRPRIRHTWRFVRQTSPGELILLPFLARLGWLHQHPVRVPGVRQVITLDFALPDRLLYLEVDGTSHRLRAERDARRDAQLAALGWRGLRLRERDVCADHLAVKQAFHSWLSTTL